MDAAVARADELPTGRIVREGIGTERSGRATDEAGL